MSVCRSASVVGGVSVATTLGAIVSAPTPYSELIAGQYVELAIICRKLSTCACIVESPVKNTGTTFGAASTDPPELVTTGWLGCIASMNGPDGPSGIASAMAASGVFEP